MKASKICPKCKSQDISMDTVYIRSFWSQHKMERWVCRACGYSEFWDPEVGTGQKSGEEA